LDLISFANGVVRSISNVIGGIVKMLQGDFAGGWVLRRLREVLGLIYALPMALIDTVGDIISPRYWRIYWMCGWKSIYKI
jgi:hypothetical protein